MTKLLHVEMLGGFQVTGGSITISRFRTRQTASLFAYLIVNRGRQIPREVLSEMFWPEAKGPEKARASLSVSLSSLRSQLEAGQAGKVLFADTHTLSVRADVVSADVRSTVSGPADRRRAVGKSR